MLSRFVGIPVVLALLVTGDLADRPLVMPLQIDDTALPAIARASEMPIRFAAPIEMTDRVGAQFRNLVILDDAGRRVEYAIEDETEPGVNALDVPLVKAIQFEDRARHIFEVKAEPGFEANSLILDIADPTFDAEVSVASSMRLDDPAPQSLIDRAPLFRRQYGERLQVNWTAARPQRYLYITIKPHFGHKPIAVTGATLLGDKKNATEESSFDLSTADITNGPEETWIKTALPARNLFITKLVFDLPGVSSPRGITISALRRDDRGVSYQAVGTATTGFQAGIGKVEIPILSEIPVNELIITVHNGRERPVEIRSIQAFARRTYMLMRHRPGAHSYTISFGGADLNGTRLEASWLRGVMADTPVLTLADSAVRIGAVISNPAYVTPLNVVSAIAEKGALITTDAWRRRKSILIASPGIQRVDLDAEVIANSRPDGRDLRIVDSDVQIPYLLLRSGVPDQCRPVVVMEASGRIGRWSLTLPAAPLPVTHITMKASSPIFRRKMIVYEMTRDQAGRSTRHVLGEDALARNGTEVAPELVLSLQQSPRTSTIWIELDNGDNAPLALDDFQAFYPGAYLLFKKLSSDPCLLFFGNSEAEPPSYDIELVARDIIAEKPNVAHLGPMETANHPPWWKIDLDGPIAFWAYWGTLAAVAVGLIVVIARLLPDNSEKV